MRHQVETWWIFARRSAAPAAVSERLGDGVKSKEEEQAA